MNQGRAGGVIQNFRISRVSHRKSLEGMLTADIVRAVEEQQEGYVDLLLRENGHIGIAAADQRVGVEDTDWAAGSFVRSTGNRGGACTAGALAIDTDGGSNSTFWVCGGGTWSAK